MNKKQAKSVSFLILIYSIVNINALALGGYYQSWSAKWVGNGESHSLAQIPSYISYVLVSFADPKMNYVAGSETFQGTGLQFSSDFNVVKAAIAIAHQNNQNQKFLLSVGGASYPWSNPNFASMINLMNDLGMDGIDIDYENTPLCKDKDTDSLSCNTDQPIIDIINNLNSNIPSQKMLTAAVFSVGAYGTNDFPNSQFGPVSDYAGMWVNPLKNSGDKLDALFVMSYDASPAYSPTNGFNAYARLFKKTLLLGLEVPPEAWGGYELTVGDALNYASHVKDNNGEGVFIWSLHKQNGGTNANTFMRPICGLYALSNCDKQIPLD